MRKFQSMTTSKVYLKIYGLGKNQIHWFGLIFYGNCHEELELADNKDQNYFETFFRFLNPDVSLEELNQSESKSKYVKGVSSCRTYVIYISEDSDLSGSDSETLYITVKTTRACCDSCCYLL